MAGKIKAVALTAIVVAMAVVLLPPQGEAHAAQANGRCSLPYVTDVNPYGKRYVATVEVAGDPIKVKAYAHGRQVRIDRIGKHTWMLPVKKGKMYTIKARSTRSGWRVIRYEVVRL